MSDFSISFGPFRVWTTIFDTFWLDGGAMFGIVPKTIWSKWVQCDCENRVMLVTRSLLVQTDERLFLIDTGSGEKHSEKFRNIYRLEQASQQHRDFQPSAITDVILTHLHFDHVGGLTAPGPDGGTVPIYPKARVYVQRDNFERAKQPSAKERASYLAGNVDAVAASNVTFLQGTTRIHPGITLHRSDGHTRGLQWVEVRHGSDVIAYPGDMIPSSHHLPVSYQTGYDMHAELLLAEKEALLSQAEREGWIVVFQHDPAIPAARIKRNERGHFAVAEVVGEHA